MDSDALIRQPQRPLNPPHEPRFVLLCKLVLPNPQHAPPGTAQCARHQPIAHLVAGNLLIPVPSIAPGHPTMLRATMPEAAVNKHGQPLPPENEIRAAGQGSASAPAGDPVCAKESNQRQLGRLVPTTPDSAHDFRALRNGKRVGPSLHQAEQSNAPKWRANASANSGGTALPTWRS